MLQGLLKGKFFSKCKSDIKLIRTRIEIIRKKRNTTQKYLRNDIADLLRNGMDVHAFGRTGGLITEMIRSQCYELIDKYCEHILTNLTAMNKQREECPEECREAASSLVYAAARIADLPELRDLRTMFTERYGKSLDYYVNKQFADKLKSDPPSNEMKLQLLQEIAAESGLEWDSKSLENELFNEPAYDKKVVKDHNSRVDGSARKDLPDATRNEEILATRRDAISPPLKDIQVDRGRTNAKPNEAKGEEEDEPFTHRLVPPPYTKPDSNKAKSSSSEDSDSSKEGDDTAFRARNLKPSQGDEKENKEEREVSVSQGRRILKFFDGGGHDQRDDEEKLLDRLLRYYSRRRGGSKNGKAEQTDSSRVSQDGRIRASSFHIEPRETPPKQHARASSDSHAAPHVHPKLPDYDEFLARLEAFRGK